MELSWDRYHPLEIYLAADPFDQSDPLQDQAAQALAEPVALKDEVGQVVAVLMAAAAAEASTEAPLVLLCQAHRYFVTFPFNFLIAALTGTLTSRLCQ
ncbi:hypothetical protein ACI2KR_29955 [Pseudomonas luteola]